MYCFKCGEQIPESLKECPNCGCPVDSKRRFENKQTKKTKVIIGLIIGVIVIVCLSIVIYNITPVQNYIAEVEQNRAELRASEEAFKEAIEAEKNNDYELAIKKYEEVIKEDKSYDKAQEKIEELQDTYKAQLLSDAENYMKNKKYNEAIISVNKVISLFGSSEELIGLKQKYIELEASQYAKIELIEKTSIEKDYSKYIFNDMVAFALLVTNNTEKTIKGIEGTAIFKDMFGKEIISMGCDITGCNIASNDSYGTVMSYEINPFNDDDMKLFNTAQEDLELEYKIKSIVFDDGTSISLE